MSDMTPQYADFMSTMGFTLDPFEHTNADQEPQLDAYFVPPPYFESVLGNPASPKSQVILAPRGGGKSAQRRMVELASITRPGEFLCITYDQFAVSTLDELNKVNLNFHLRRINELLIIAILALVEGDPSRAAKLEKGQRANIALLARAYLDGMTAAAFKDGLSSVKTLGVKSNELWTKFGSSVGAFVATCLKFFGIPAQTPNLAEAVKKAESTIPLDFRELLAAVQSIGFKATYVLVDKIDENAASSTNPQAAFSLIRPLILDLSTLEAPGSAFKFFLWDVIRAAYKQAGARTDRIPLYDLNWKQAELAEMLKRRLLALSINKIGSFNALCDPNIGIDVHSLLPHFAEGSPRDMIRLAKRIISEHTKTDQREPFVTLRSIENGLRAFSDERASEIFGDFVADVRRVARPAFTINQLANDVYRVSTQAARARVQAWQEKRLVKKIGEIPNRMNRPLHLYGIEDPRLVVAILPKVSFADLLYKTLFVCDTCSHLAVKYENMVICTRCGTERSLSQIKSFGETCRATVPNSTVNAPPKA